MLKNAWIAEIRGGHGTAFRVPSRLDITKFQEPESETLKNVKNTIKSTVKLLSLKAVGFP